MFRPIVPHRHGQCLLLADEHDQLLAPRDPGIDQVALQEQVVLHGQRNDYGREFRALRLVDRDRVAPNLEPSALVI